MLVDAPTKQNASAMHTSTSSRSNGGGGGLNGSSHSAVSIHEIGNVSKAPFSSSLGKFRPILPASVPLTPERQCRHRRRPLKIVMIQWFFKISLSLK
jgi:hypothetical protein